ncbi:MAG: family 16 glycosylhydrolase [Planctomycetota bacterium]
MTSPGTLTTRRLLAAALIAGVSAPLLAPTSAQILIDDDFDGTGIIDWETWRIPFGGDGSFLGRTQLGTDPNTDVPEQVNGSAVLTLNTTSPVDPGGAFFGQEFQSRASFARGGGLAVEYVARLDPASIPSGVGGVVGGLFSFDTTRSVGGNLVRDEIDTAELLTNEVASGQNRNFTNLWNDGGFDSGGNPAFVNAPADLTAFNTYRTEWTPDAVRFFVNGNLVRTVTGADVPDDPMSVRANIWAPDAGFVEAYDASLVPTADAGSNQEIRLEVDRITVERFNTTLSDNLLTNGSFENGTTGWNLFGNASVESATADPSIPTDDGDGVLKTFGPFSGSTNASGAFQDVPALPGQEFEAMIRVINSTTANGGLDDLTGTNNFAELGIQFLDASGNFIDADQDNDPFVSDNQRVVSVVDGRDPNIISDEYLTGVTNAIAPEGTAFARINLPFVQLIDDNGGPDGGAAYWDSASLRLIEAAAALGIIGDYDDSGQVEQGDLNLVLNNWGQAAPFDPNGDPFATVNVDQEELNRVLNNWGSTTAPSFEGAAVPEPGALAVAGLALAGLLKRRR